MRISDWSSDVCSSDLGLTPLAMATAPIATQAKVPMVVTAAATSAITEASPYIVRTSFTLPQATLGIARWAADHDIGTVVTLVSDYAPGADAAAAFRTVFTAGDGEVVEEGSEERRVGKACGSTCRSRWSPSH